MPLAPGTRLGPYEILSSIGAGGMGEVYRAEDTRLGRAVAVKTLPAEKLADPERTPDGEELLFSSNRTGRSGLWRISASGGTPVRVPLAGTDPRQPAAHGNRLAYVQQTADTNIWAVPASGTGDPVRIVSSTLNDLTPNYSPDGRRIASCSDRSGSLEIWVASSASRPTALARLRASGSGRQRHRPGGAFPVAGSAGPPGRSSVARRLARSRSPFLHCRARAPLLESTRNQSACPTRMLTWRHALRWRCSRVLRQVS